MTCYSVGFHRDDGDFAILATFNNNDELFTDKDFETIVFGVKALLRGTLLADGRADDCIVLERQDAPDYVTLD